MTTKLAKIQPATPAQAASMTAQVDEAYSRAQGEWFNLGKLLKGCMDCQVPRAMGLSAHEWMKMRFPESPANRVTGAEWGVNAAYRSLRVIGLVDEGIAEEKLIKMGKENAYQLTRLPVSRRREKHIQAAQSTPIRDFKKLIDQERRGGKPQGPESEIYREEWVSTGHLFPGIHVIPGTVAEKLREAVVKMARVLVLDVERDPAKQIQSIESIANLVNETSELRLKVETVGLSHEEEQALREEEAEA